MSASSRRIRVNRWNQVQRTSAASRIEAGIHGRRRVADAFQVIRMRGAGYPVSLKLSSHELLACPIRWAAGVCVQPALTARGGSVILNLHKDLGLSPYGAERPMDRHRIVIKGASEHNLKGIDLEIPKDSLVVITGVSGSGKSSLAFDTIYAEGQRRYVESLSAYARQFLDQMEKPDVDHIEGLSPAISIEQRSASHNPRSTVATVTEIHDYLRVLFARAGEPHCPKCGRPISAQTVQQMADRLMALEEGTLIQVFAPVVRGRKGEYRELLSEMPSRGYLRARIDGKMV